MQENARRPGFRAFLFVFLFKEKADRCEAQGTVWLVYNARESRLEQFSNSHGVAKSERGGFFVRNSHLAAAAFFTSIGEGL